MNDEIGTPTSSANTQVIIKKTLDIICGKWRLYIIFQLEEQARRYGELRRLIPEVSEKVLIQELKALVALGVLEKTSYGEIPPRVEYSLSEKGRKVLPVLIQLRSVGETFLES